MHLFKKKRKEKGKKGCTKPQDVWQWVKAICGGGGEEGGNESHRNTYESTRRGSSRARKVEKGEEAHITRWSCVGVTRFEK